MTTERYTRDGKVAVLYSPRYGAGWYSWNEKHPGMLFDPEIVEAVLGRDRDLAAKIAESKYPDCCTLGAEDLMVEWLDPGERFRISEYDGYESVVRVAAEDVFIA